MATIAGVARKAGVSVSIASRVWNGTWVSPSPAHPVEAAIHSPQGRHIIIARHLNAPTSSIVKAVRKRGPLSVVGSDGVAGSSRFEPRLRPVLQPCPEIGRRAVVLGERIAVRPSLGRTLDLDAAKVESKPCGRPT